MKSFKEWRELNEAGFFSNLFGKNPAPTTLPPLLPKPKGMNIDDFHKLFNDPKQEPASHDEPESAPQIKQSQMVPPKSTASPVEYIEDIANRYWKGHGELNDLWNRWQQSKQENDKNKRGRLLYQIYQTLSHESGSLIKAVMGNLIKILEDECRWEAFPQEDEAVISNTYGSNHLRHDEFSNYTRQHIGEGDTVIVLAKGFRRLSDVMQKARVVKKEEKS